MRSIYVAGASSERDACAADISALKTAGWTVTHDWTKDVGYDNPSLLGDHGADVGGVYRAEFLWLRTPVEKSEGSHAELGMMIMLRFIMTNLGKPAAKAIVVSGPWREKGRLFTHAADLKFDAHEQALKWFLEYAP